MKEVILSIRYGAIIIKVIIPNIPMKPSPIKNFILTPAINNKANILIIIIIPVPKSGCSMIKPNTSANTSNIGITPSLILFINLFYLNKYLLVIIIIPIFANSLG